MRNNGLIAVFLILLAGIAPAQSISGRVADSLGKPVPYSPVALVLAPDSLVYKGAMTDENGHYFFDHAAAGLYRICIDLPGYRRYYSMAFTLDSLDSLVLPVHTLQFSGVKLDEVAITAVKRSVEFRNGNIIVNIENSALATGNTAYDLLMHLPGVSVDPVNNNITIQGREGVKVMIDGRVQQLGGQQLINLLRSISAASIAQMEVLKNPPIRYDASGTAGIIHIKTKKMSLYGFSGSLSTSVSQGFYGRGESGFSLNYRSRKFNVFSSVFSEYGKFIYVNRFNRTVAYNNRNTQMDQEHTQTEFDRGGEANTGLDWYVSDKTTVGFKITNDPGKENLLTRGNVFLSDSGSGYNRLDYYFTMPGRWSYNNYNINAEHKLDTSGGKIRFSADYSPNEETAQAYFDNRFLSGDQNLLPPRIFKAKDTEHIDLFSALLDVEKQIGAGTGIEAGLKLNQQQLWRRYAVANRDDLTGNDVQDTALSYFYTYSEKIMASYGQVEQELGDFNFQLGLRAEQTLISAGVEGRDRWNREYFNLFPLANVEYEVNSRHELQLSYNRRINRPEGFSLIPYKYFWGNIFVTETGNPDLKPEYSNTLEFTHVYKGIISNALAFSRLENYLLQYSFQNDSSKEMVVSVANLKSSTTLGYSLFFEAGIRNWWQMSGNLMFSYKTYAGKVNGLDYSASGLGYSGLLTNIFLLPKELKLEVEGQYIGPNPMGVFTPQPRWALNLALKRSFLKDRKLDLTIGISDVFYTLIGRNQVSFQNQRWEVSETHDSRRIKISLSYQFGKIKSEERETSSNEEQRERLKH